MTQTLEKDEQKQEQKTCEKIENKLYEVITKELDGQGSEILKSIVEQVKEENSIDALSRVLK